MAKNSRLTTDNKFIVKSFLDATHAVDFHKKWMTTETWAALVFHHFEFPSSLKYGGKQLHKAITLYRKLAGIQRVVHRWNKSMCSEDGTNKRVQREIFTATMQLNWEGSP
jgi:hypothetical protein